MTSTNGERIERAIGTARMIGRELARWAAEHPDEVAVLLAPTVALTLSTARHRLDAAEAAIVAEAGYWLGVLACKEYRDWKARPVPVRAGAKGKAAA